MKNLLQELRKKKLFVDLKEKKIKKTTYGQYERKKIGVFFEECSVVQTENTKKKNLREKIIM